MEAYLIPLLNDGGFAGALVVIVVLLVGFVLREKGKLVAPTPRSEMSELRERLGSLDNRMTAMERDVGVMPTKDDLHAVGTEQARLGEQLKALDRMVTATSSAVGRIEGFMIKISERNAGK